MPESRWGVTPSTTFSPSEDMASFPSRAHKFWQRTASCRSITARETEERGGQNANFSVFSTLFPRSALGLPRKSTGFGPFSASEFNRNAGKWGLRCFRVVWIKWESCAGESGFSCGLEAASSSIFSVSRRGLVCGGEGRKCGGSGDLGVLCDFRCSVSFRVTCGSRVCRCWRSAF